MAKPAFGISFELANAEIVAENFERAPYILTDSLRKHVLWATPFMERQVKIQATNRKIKRRSGRYVAGIRHAVTERETRYGREASGIVGTNVKYARIIELGEPHHKATKSKIGLAVPFKFAKTRAGVSKKPRQYKGFLVKRERDSKWFLFGKRTPKSKKIVPLFHFEKEVELKPKLVFSTAFTKNEKRLRTSAERRLNRALQKAFSKGGK